MKYRLALIVCGIAWFGIVRLCLRRIGASSELPLIVDLLCAVITAESVGAIFEVKIQTQQGWRYYLLLPLGTLATGVVLYSFLISFAALILGTAEHEAGPQPWTLLAAPAVMLMYSLTVFLPLLYPSTLVTNALLRRLLLAKKEPIQPPQTTTGSSAPDRV